MLPNLPLAILPYPEIDPVIVSLGPVAIRWYGLAYAVGLLLGWRYVLRLNRGPAALLQKKQVDDLLIWMALGVIIGGRLGSVLFYNLPYYIEHPIEILMVWHGGMSFHGGVLGVIVALLIFARWVAVPFLRLTDLVVAAIPIGLFFGRLANFINAELYGRATEVPWAMVFPSDPAHLPRHPSQLYEAGLEGVVLFLLLAWLAWRTGAYRRPGLLSGVFLIGYGVVRSLVELVRQPDQQLGFFVAGSTMGQWLSLPMLLGGLVLVWVALKRPPATP